MAEKKKKKSKKKSLKEKEALLDKVLKTPKILKKVADALASGSPLGKREDYIPARSPGSEVEEKRMMKFLAVNDGQVVPVTILRDGDVEDKDVAKLVTLALQDIAQHFRRISATPPSLVTPHQAVGNPGGNKCRRCRQKVTLDHGVWRGETGKVGCVRSMRIWT